MPRRRRTDKFFIYAPDRHGKEKWTRLLGVNNLGIATHTEEPSLGDLLRFLEENKVNPDEVAIPGGFITRTLFTLSSSQISGMGASGKPVELSSVLKTPGIYKFRKDEVCDAVVVTTGGQILYVYIGVTSNKVWKERIYEKVWRVRCSAPSRVVI